MRKATTIVNALINVLKIVGSICLVGMMLLTSTDVTLRAFGKPILGVEEIVGFMATLVLAFAMPYTHRERGHIGVDMIVRKLSRRTQGIVDSITGILAFILFLIIAWQSGEYAGTMRRTGEVSMTLEFPSYIFVYGVSLAFLILSLAILIDVVRSFKKAISK